MASIINQLKSTSLLKQAKDYEILSKNRLLDDLEGISEAVASKFLDRDAFGDYREKPFHHELLEYKNAGDKLAFLEIFDAYRSKFELVWDSADYNEIIAALCRAIVNRSYVQKKKPLDYLYLDAKDVPFGNVKFSAQLSTIYTDEQSLTNLRYLKNILGHAYDFIPADNFEEYLKTVGLSVELFSNREKALSNIIYKKIDFDLRGGYLANVTDKGIFYNPISNKFLDNSADYVDGRVFNIQSSPYPDPNAILPEGSEDKFIASVHEAHKKYKDHAYWDITASAFNVNKAMELLIGGCMVSARVLSDTHIMPAIISFRDDEGTKHSIVVDNIYALFHFSEIRQVSNNEHLTLKVNTKTGEVMIVSDQNILNLEKKIEHAFVILKSVDDLNSISLLGGYTAIDLTAFEIAQTVREKERERKRSAGYDKILNALILTVKGQQAEKKEQAAEVAATIATAVVNEPTLEELAESHSHEFYDKFIESCQKYVDGYTEIKECVSREGKLIDCRVPLPNDNSFLKNNDTQEFIMKDGKRVENYRYVYSARESFWLNNNNPSFPIPELIAFFITRADNVNYVRLSEQILGFDCSKYADLLADRLIKEGYLCVDDISIDYETKTLNYLTWVYHADYTKGNVAEKLKKLIGDIDISGERKKKDATDLERTVVDYFGSEMGEVILSAQEKMLRGAMNKPMEFVLENAEQQKAYQLELSVDNKVIWEEADALFKENLRFPTSFPVPTSENKKMEIVRRSMILSQFRSYLDGQRANPLVAEFNTDLNELFDACVVPMNSTQYIEKYILPRWTINGVSSPIVLPEYGYTKGSGSKEGVMYRKLRFSKADLMRWDGDGVNYKKDMREGVTGDIVRYEYKGKPTDHMYFKFNSTTEGREAEKKWKAVVDDLLTLAIEPYNRRKSVATTQCNIMFNLFLQTAFAITHRNKLQKKWNDQFNTHVLPSYDRYPIFPVFSKYFGANRNEPFAFTPVQLNGMRQYIARDNSITLGHDVGYGKTSSSIGIISHMFETGEASRVLLVVPNIVYDKWKKEMVGDATNIGLAPHINIIDLYNATDEPIKKLKIFTAKELEVLSSFKKIFKVSYDVSLKKLPNKRYSRTKHSAQDILNLLSKAIPNYSTYRPLMDFQEEIEFAFEVSNEEYSTKERIIEAERGTKLDKAKEAKKSNAEIKKINELYDAKIEKITEEINIELTKMITAFINTKKDSLVDELGQYKPEVMKPKSVILCTKGAMSRLRASLSSGIEAIAIIDDAFGSISEEFTYEATKELSGGKRAHKIRQFKNGSAIGNDTTRKSARTDVFKLSISLQKLNVDGFIVDEVHDYNSIVTSARKRFVTSKLTSRTNLFQYGKASFGAGGSADTAIFQYYTQNSGERIIQSVNALAVARDIQNRNRRNLKNGNTTLLSATPFVDSPLFQMVSVFAIMNYELLLSMGISGVYDVFNQFATEQWKLDLRHDKKIGNFPQVDKYKNIYANSNLLRMFVDFKITDPIIEKTRPKKYSFPDQLREFNKVLTLPPDAELNSFVPMNKFQEEAKERVLDFMHGKIGQNQLFDPNYTPSEETDTDDELVDIDTESNETMLALEGLKRGQLIYRTDNKKYYELIVAGGESYDSNWFEHGAERPATRVSDEETEKVEVVETDESGDSVVVLDEFAGDIEKSIEKGVLSEADLKKAKTIMGMKSDQNISCSPYMAEMKIEGLPPLRTFDTLTKKYTVHPENFVENTPKLAYISKCIKSVLDYHKAKGEEPSAQIVYLERKQMKYDGFQYNPLELFRDYLANNPDIDIKKEEIAIIIGGGSETVKRQIAEDFNSGKYKLLLGTSAIKQGVDLQVNTSVMYIVQADYVPSTLMQVEGRAWRQGNKWKNIRMVYVMSYGSLDAFQLSKVNQKITQIKKMLDTTVFDMNTTQFDRDFDKMKLVLETRIDKKAELLYAIEKQEMDSQYIRYEQEFKLLSDIKVNIKDYGIKWELFIAKLNRIGAKLESSSIKEGKKELTKLLVSEKKREQSKIQEQIISDKEKEIEKENAAYEKEMLKEVATLKSSLSKIKKGDPKEEKKQIKEINDKIKEAESASKKAKINSEAKKEILRTVTDALREEHQAIRDAITVTDEEARQFITSDSRTSTSVLPKTLFDIPDKDGDYYIHTPLLPESSYQSVQTVINKIKDKAGRPVRAFDNAMQSGFGAEKLAEYSGIRDAFVAEGYEKENSTDVQEWYRDMFGKNAGYEMYRNSKFYSGIDKDKDLVWDAFIIEVDSFKFSSVKGRIVKQFYELVKDLSLLDDRLEETEKMKDAIADKLANKDAEIKKIIKQLEKDRQAEKALGAYDVDGQAKLFDSTNIVLVKR